MFHEQTKSLFTVIALLGGLLFVNVGRTTVASANWHHAAFHAPQTTASFQDGVDGYTGTRDTYIYDVNPTTAHGSEITMVQDKNPSDDRTSLLSFDLSSIPAGSIVSSAELELYVDTEGQGFDMHRMLVSWDEATVTYSSIGNRHFAADDNDAESSVDANWPGVNNYVGFITVSVPAATIQAWIDGTLTNNGWLMIATHASDGQQLRTREHGTVAHRPKLTVEYSEPPADPTIIVNGPPLSAFSSEPGTPSAEQSYTVAGANLTTDIEIMAPADFQISTSSGSGFGASLTLLQSGGSVATTTIYVRFERATAGAASGDISHTSTDAATQNVAVSGTAAVTKMLQDGTDGYSGTRDTYIYDVNPTTAHGSDTTMVQDKNATNDRTSLLSFDLSAIAAGTVVSSAELQLYVDTEGQGFDMHRMLVSWDEATVTYSSIGNRHFAADDNDAESSVDANWPGDDDYVGFITVSIPTATIQAWLDGTLANNGWLMIATHASDGQQLRTREHATAAHRPKLTLVYSHPVSPTVTISTSQITRSNETPSCIYNLLHSGSPYDSFIVSQADIDTTPIDISGSIGGAPDYYYVEDNCGGGGTAVSKTVGEFSFDIEPGT